MQMTICFCNSSSRRPRANFPMSVIFDIRAFTFGSANFGPQSLLVSGLDFGQFLGLHA